MPMVLARFPLAGFRGIFMLVRLCSWLNFIGLHLGGTDADTRGLLMRFLLGRVFYGLGDDTLLWLAPCPEGQEGRS